MVTEADEQRLVKELAQLPQLTEVVLALLFNLEVDEIDQMHADLLNELPQCAWCLARDEIRGRLFGMNLCGDCVPAWPVPQVVGDMFDPPREDLRMWAGRRKHLIQLGWPSGGRPPELDV